MLFEKGTGSFYSYIPSAVFAQCGYQINICTKEVLDKYLRKLNTWPKAPPYFCLNRWIHLFLLMVIVISLSRIAVTLCRLASSLCLQKRIRFDSHGVMYSKQRCSIQCLGGKITLLAQMVHKYAINDYLKIKDWEEKM